MNSLYRSPLRVYLCLGFLALLGIYSGLKLPVSLFPNSSRPSVVVYINYGVSTADEFLNTYGRNFEEQLRTISTGRLEVNQIEATYDKSEVRFTIQFKWGTDPREAIKEVQLMASAFASQLPYEMRDSLRVWSWGENTGFLAISYYSQKRSLDDVYNYLEPILTPLLARVKDASEVELWNPSRKEIQIQLNPEKMALFSLLPKNVSASLIDALNGSGGGSVSVGLNQYEITLRRPLQTVEDVGKTVIPTPSGKPLHLSDIAHIDLGVPRTSEKSINTSGAPSLILYADPRPGGNIKRMAEEIITIVKQINSTLPPDIQYKILVDPSEFIRSAVNNVFHEVVLAAFLAVCVLFLFIGSLKNVVTAAIEIPMSIMLAFILMRLSGINLNIISLGGLALSAGMNVDASVVVMENIFRHFEEVKGPLDFETRFRLVCEAVNEVKFPVIASTLASLVVFMPLAFTSGLSNALLGDLALAVVFSHSFSAVVALLLVPTVRLQLMAGGDSGASRSPIEVPLKKLELTYVRLLKAFMNSRLVKPLVYGGLCVVLAALSYFVIPRLQKEIIGRPDTDWIDIFVSTQGNTLVNQMKTQSEEIEARLIKQFGDKIQYTFTQTRNPNNSTIMARLKDKSQMKTLWKEMEHFFVNTPEMKYWVGPWNPSELSIPDPPQLKISIRGGEVKERSKVAQEISNLLEEKKTFTNVNTNPGVQHREGVVIKPHFEQWPFLIKDSHLLPSDLSDVARVATVGRRVGMLPVDGRLVPLVLQYPEDKVASLEDLARFPLGVKGKLVPMKSLADIDFEALPNALYRLDSRELVLVTGKMSEEDKGEAPQRVKSAIALIEQWKKTHSLPTGVSMNYEDAEQDLNEALDQLEWAVGLSILLIFLTMILQFGDVINALIVMVAIPLGFIGVLGSLYLAKSTLSLNSVLGVILLNGIAVANSIILVDFLKKLVERGHAPKEAALMAAQKRFRPILMTSMTTALGMLPVAMGWGEGGRILQPLGIAVVGGLAFSMLTTLFLVPTLQVGYLNLRRNKYKRPSRLPEISH